MCTCWDRSVLVRPLRVERVYSVAVLGGLTSHLPLTATHTTLPLPVEHSTHSMPCKKKEVFAGNSVS